LSKHPKRKKDLLGKEGPPRGKKTKEGKNSPVMGRFRPPREHTKPIQCAFKFEDYIRKYRRRHARRKEERKPMLKKKENKKKPRWPFKAGVGKNDQGATGSGGGGKKVYFRKRGIRENRPVNPKRKSNGRLQKNTKGKNAFQNASER